MNNQLPFFIPNMPPNYPSFNNNIDLEKLLNKINRLEKNIRILEKRITQLEGNQTNNDKNYYQDDPTDMYII